jgi:hypothetical protein
MPWKNEADYHIRRMHRPPQPASLCFSAARMPCTSGISAENAGGFPECVFEYAAEIASVQTAAVRDFLNGNITHVISISEVPRPIASQYGRGF